jgi:sugar O-acyltransferase (sialic acid O-acetyltransferase NeuD family)
MMKTDVIILGAGGHAKVLIDALRQQSGIHIIGILDPNPARLGQEILGVRVIGNDDEIKHYAPENVRVVNAVGSIDLPSVRKNIFLRFKAKGYTFLSVLHPHAYIAPSAMLGEGCQVMAGSVIQACAVVGSNVIINTHAAVDHDCWLADHIHLAPGAVLSGGVRIEEESHIGARAVIIQGVSIGKKCLVGAGAVVIRSIKAGSRVVGVPAKEISTIKEECWDEELE